MLVISWKMGPGWSAKSRALNLHFTKCRCCNTLPLYSSNTRLGVWHHPLENSNISNTLQLYFGALDWCLDPVSIKFHICQLSTKMIQLLTNAKLHNFSVSTFQHKTGLVKISFKTAVRTAFEPLCRQPSVSPKISRMRWILDLSSLVHWASWER